MNTITEIPVRNPAFDELAKLNQWVCHDRKKIPINPNSGERASSTNFHTWGSVDDAMNEAVKLERNKRVVGIGFVFTETDCYVGIDIDKCVDENGCLDERARKIVKTMDSYTEYSPSKTGLHIILKGLWDGRRNKIDGLEVYDRERYFTVTGKHLEGTPETINERQAQLDQLFKEEFNSLLKDETSAKRGQDIDLDAELPKDKFENLLLDSKKFRQSWKHEREDLKDTSPSGYDMSLATIAALHGWTDQEIVALVVSHIRKYGDPKGKSQRQDYIRAVVKKARKSVSTGNGNGNGAGKDTWPDPEEINTELLTVQSLPFQILPEPFRPWIEDVSHRMQCPPDFVAVAALTLAASVIGTRCGIRPKQNDDWLVIANLWGGVVGLPSTLKSPSIKEAMKPLSRLEVEAKRNFDVKAKQYQVDLIESQARRDSMKAEMKQAAGGKGKRSIEKIKEELLELEEPEKPAMIRYKTNDATIEKLSELLNENPNGLLLFRDELVGLLASWEKPGRESDRAFFLESWNGDNSHTSDRIGRGTIFTENLCLSVFGGIQPSKLTSYLIQSMNGLENDGLFQRLQLLVYPDEVVDWQFVDKAPDRGARERAYRIIERLANMDFTEFKAVKYESERFPYLNFSSEAQNSFNEWLTDLELKKLRVDDHSMILEHFGKYRSLMPSLALIFHLIDVADGLPGGPVSLPSTEKAAAFCEYLESHVRRVYGLVADVDQQAAAVLVEKIQAGRLSDGFTVRDVYRQNWRLLNSKELAQVACDELVEAGWLKRKITQPAFGQKEKVEYVINPKIPTPDS